MRKGNPEHSWQWYSWSPKLLSKRHHWLVSLSASHIEFGGLFWTTTYFSPKIIRQPNVWTPTQSLSFEVKGITNKNSVSLVRGLCTSIYHETISLPKPFCHTISCLHLVVPIFLLNYCCWKMSHFFKCASKSARDKIKLEKYK